MDNLAPINQSNALSQYSRGQADRTYADQHESLLGHLICERGKDVKSALEDLRPIVKTTHKETLTARDWCMKFGFGGIGVGVLVGAGMGIGFAVLPIIAGTVSLKFWADSRNEVPRREAEYHLLKTVGDLPEALYALHLRGVDTVRLVSAYDALVAAIEARLEDSREFSEAEVGEFLQAKIQAQTGLEATTQSQSGIQNGGAEGNAKTESQALAPTELQPIALGVAASPSMQVINGVETIAKAAEPDYLARIWQIIDRNNNFFIGGQPGSGKGVMVSNLIRRKLDQYPGSIAVYIDPKGSPREDGNFTDPRITRLKICGVGMSRSEYSIEVAEMLETARGFVDQCDIENGNHVWIVFDEIMNMKQKLSKDLFGEVQDLLVDCVSMGDDQGLHTIALTQSFNAGDTVGSDELLKNLALIACFKEDDFPRAKKLVQYGKTNHETYSTEEFSRLVRKSPRKRVICIGGGFIPAPEMPLLSGWDRDKGAKVDSSQPAISTFTAKAIQSDDTFDDLPALFQSVAMMAMAAQTASDRSIIINDLNHAKAAVEANDITTVKDRLGKYV